MANDIKQTNQLIEIKNKNLFISDGVLAVLSFDDDYLSLDTVYGKLVIEGKELKIIDLSKENTKISVSGNITGVYFDSEKKKKGFFG